jgi:hypothetical protein
MFDEPLSVAVKLLLLVADPKISIPSLVPLLP